HSRRRVLSDARHRRRLAEADRTVAAAGELAWRRIGHCAWPQLVDKWTRSGSTLTDILGTQVQVASIPGGDFAPQVAEAAAKAGFTRLFTSEPTLEVRHAFGLALRPIHDSALDGGGNRRRAGRRRVAALRAPGRGLECEEDQQA